MAKKTNQPEASLRKDSLPQPEKVRDAVVQEGAAVRCAEQQNTNDQGDPTKKRNVIPNKSDESLVVTAVAKVKE